MQNLWDSIPAPVRSIINVCLGAALAAAVAYLANVVSGEHFDPSLLLAAVGTAVATALVRALNPLDSGYGVGGGGTTPPPADGPQDVVA